MDTEGRRRYISNPFASSAIEGCGWSGPRPGRFAPGKNRIPISRSLAGPRSRSGRATKTSTPTEFHPRTVQPEANRYTNWNIPAALQYLNRDKFAIYLPLPFVCGQEQRSWHCDSLRAGRSEDRIPLGTRISVPVRPSRLTMGPTQPPIQWMSGLHQGGKAAGAWCWQPTTI